MQVSGQLSARSRSLPVPAFSPTPFSTPFRLTPSVSYTTPWYHDGVSVWRLTPKKDQPNGATINQVVSFAHKRNKDYKHGFTLDRKGVKLGFLTPLYFFDQKRSKPETQNTLCTFVTKYEAPCWMHLNHTMKVFAPNHFPNAAFVSVGVLSLFSSLNSIMSSWRFNTAF